MNNYNGITETSVTEGARRATGVTDVSTQKEIRSSKFATFFA